MLDLVFRIVRSAGDASAREAEVPAFLTAHYRIRAATDPTLPTVAVHCVRPGAAFSLGIATWSGNLDTRRAN
jgi:hypothetical protein